jgi:hypothetical protein
MKIEDCKVGMKVLFGRSQGEQTLGEITKVNSVKCKVKQLESRGTMKSYPVGTIWGVPASLMTPTVTSPAGWQMAVAPVVAPAKPKRPDAEIMNDIESCYNQLSPENLTCDGECSRSEVARRRTAINARLKVLFAEIGRKVSEDEAYGMPASTFHSPVFAPAKVCPFKKGDKVCFTAKGGSVVTGFVRTLNQKTVTVDPIGGKPGQYWKVGPSMLRAA